MTPHRRLALLPPLLLAAAEVFFEERFEADSLEPRWVHSAWQGGNGPAGRFELSAGAWYADEKLQRGLRTPEDMRYHSISAKLAKSFSSRDRSLVVQFTVKHETHQYAFCGGGYMKLLGSHFAQESFGGDTPYHIMFGPDLCGYDVSRIHLIFGWQGANLPRRHDIKLDYEEKDELTHLYTLVVRPNSTYGVYFDGKEKAEIDDPQVRKPSDWVNDRQVRDPTARRPPEWDEDEDGVYEAPFIDNPAYKGEWFARRVANPAYSGEWRPRQLDNPEYVEAVHAYDDIGAVGFELWTVNKGSIFDNILVTDSLEHAKKVADEVFRPLVAPEKAAKRDFDRQSGRASDEDDEAADGADHGEDDEAAERVEL